LVATSLLEFQGLAKEWTHTGPSSGFHKDHPSYVIAKESARAVLNIRSSTLDLFEVIKDDLLEQNIGYIWSGIRSKLCSLDGFEGIYNRDVGKEIHQTAYIRPSQRHEKLPPVSIAHQQA
jgi:hypothetical protein